MNPLNPVERQSDLIKAMRFPLIVLVLLEHAVGYDPTPMQWSLDGANVYHFTTELFSHHLCSIAVPWFFVFSGFLFFNNLRENEFRTPWILEKWKRRTHSLLLPYLLWNLLNVLMVLLVTAVFNALGVTFTNEPMQGVQNGPWYWFVTGPIDFPLWYVRDLIVLSLVAPLLYLAIKKAPKVSLALLVILYFASFKLRFFLLPALSFYGVGVWMGIHHTDMRDLCNKVRYPAAILAVVLALLATAMHGQETHRLFRLLFLPFGMVTFMNLCDGMIDRSKTKERLVKLSETVFFVYAAHEIYILGWTKGLCLRLFGDGLGGMWLGYLIAPALTLAICLALFYLLKKWTPTPLAFACGWRTQHNKI